jgi:hypothetical protein
MAVSYDHSSRANFKSTFNNSRTGNTISSMTENHAKDALRILIDFMKDEVVDKGEEGLRYEPLMTQLMSLKAQYL